MDVLATPAEQDVTQRFVLQRRIRGVRKSILLARSMGLARAARNLEEHLTALQAELRRADEGPALPELAAA